MMKIRIAFLLMTILGAVSAFGFAVPNRPDDLTIEEFQKLHAEIVPQDEVWKTIPWHTDLISAQAAAIEQKKPIFIWSMDGHPLGCT